MSKCAESQNNVRFQTAYDNYQNKRNRVSLTCPEPTRTEQHHKDNVEINNILRRYEQTGILEHQNQYEGSYADLSPLDFQEYQNKIASAWSMFEALPATVRARFSNDPAQFLAFVQDPANTDEALRLGLGTRRTAEITEAPRKVTATPEPEGGASQ